MNFRDVAAVKYCRFSVSIVREWYDQEKPDVRFKVENGKFKEVSVRDCKGARAVLWKVVGKGE